MQTLPATGLAAARAFAEEALSPASRPAYLADWTHFLDWCGANGIAPLPSPPEQVAAYLASMATSHGRATIERRFVTIGQANKLAGHPWVRAHPAIRATLRGMLRLHGKSTRKAAAIGVPEMRLLVDSCDGFAGLRDRAMFLLAFAGALRRSELAGIRTDDLSFGEDGLRLFLRGRRATKNGQASSWRFPSAKTRPPAPSERSAGGCRRPLPTGSCSAPSGRIAP